MTNCVKCLSSFNLSLMNLNLRFMVLDVQTTDMWTIALKCIHMGYLIFIQGVQLKLLICFNL